jgi:hypothetical protein
MFDADGRLFFMFYRHGWLDSEKVTSFLLFNGEIRSPIDDVFELYDAVTCNRKDISTLCSSATSGGGSTGATSRRRLVFRGGEVIDWEGDLELENRQM